MTGKPSGHAHLRQGFHLRQGYGGQDGGQAGEALLGEVVPRMTSETLAQDPAEFRRKFKGLRQLYRATIGRRSKARGALDPLSVRG
jgi:hypothetical protein